MVVLKLGHFYQTTLIPQALDNVSTLLKEGAPSMFLVVVPIAIVNALPIAVDVLASAMFSILSPVTIIYGPVEIFKAADAFETSEAEAALVCADANEEHQALPLKVSVHKTTFVVVAVLKVEDALSPHLVVLPLSLISIPVSVIHCSVSFFHSLVEVSFVSVTIA